MEQTLDVLRQYWEDFQRNTGLEFPVTEGFDLVLTCILVLFVVGAVVKTCLLLVKGCVAACHCIQGMLTSPRVKRDILDTTDIVQRVEESTADAGGVTVGDNDSEDTPNEAKQNKANNDKVEDAVGLLETEEFDFDLPVSPVNREPEQEMDVDEDNGDGEEDDDEVFFGPVGFREKIVAKAKEIQEEEERYVPLELNGEQYAELFVEATRLAKELEKESRRNREEEVRHAKSEALLFKKKVAKPSPRNSPRRMTYTLDEPEKEEMSSETPADAHDSNKRPQNNVVKDGKTGLVAKRPTRIGMRNNTYTDDGRSRIGSGLRPPSSTSSSQKMSNANDDGKKVTASNIPKEASEEISEKETNGKELPKPAVRKGTFTASPTNPTTNGRELHVPKPAVRKGTFTMSPNNASSASDDNMNNRQASRNGSENNSTVAEPKQKQPVKRRSGIPAPGSRGSSLPRSQIPRKGSAGMNTSMNTSMNRSVSMDTKIGRNQNTDGIPPSMGSLGRSFSNGSIDDSDDTASVASDISDISTASAPAAVKRKGSAGSLPQNAKFEKLSAVPQRAGSLSKLSGRRRSNSTSSASRTSSSSTPAGSRGPSKKRVSGIQPPQTKPQLAKPAAVANTSFTKSLSTSKKALLPGGGYGVPMPKKQQPMRATLPMSQISTPKVHANSQALSTPGTIPALTTPRSIPVSSTPVVQDKKVVPKRISVDEPQVNANRPQPTIPSTPQGSRIPGAAPGSARRRSGIPTPRSMQRQSRLPPRGSAIPTPGSSRRSCLPTLAANDSPSEFPAPPSRMAQVQETNYSPAALRGTGPDNLPKPLIDFGDDDANGNSPPVGNLIDI